jgi:hypothetical protein
MKTKEWYKSKTMWVSLLTVLAGVATGVAGQLEAGVSITVLGVVNMFLRAITKEAIKVQ